MPPNDFDQQSVLAFVAELSNRIDELKKELTSLGNQAGTGMRKVSDETEKFGDTVKEESKTIEGMKKETGGLLGLLRGPVGLASLFIASERAMEGFVVGQLQLRNFAVDVGISAEAVNRFRVQLGASGIDSQTADRELSALTATLQDIKIYREGSPRLQKIALNDPAFAAALLRTEQVGDRMESIRLVMEKYAREKEGGRTRPLMVEMFGVSESTYQAWLRNPTGVHQLTTFDPKVLDEYNKNAQNLTTDLKNMYGASMMYFINETSRFVESSKIEFGKLSDFVKGVQEDFEGRGKKGGEVFGPKGILPNKEELGGLFGSKGFLPDKEELGGAWDWLMKTLGPSEAHADVPTGNETLLQQDGGARPIGSRISTMREKLTLEKQSNQYVQDIHDVYQRWDRGIGGVGASGGGGGPGRGGPMGLGGRSSGEGGPVGDGGGGGPNGQGYGGGQAQVTDESGNPIDQATMKQAETLGRSGDVAGLQKLFAQKGYRMSGPACGIIASKYARAAGFKPPPSGAIATEWHKFGEQIKPEDINKPGHPFGSMFGTYWHRRYGGDPSQILAPGQTGGHVMTIVPGSYNPKTGTVDVVDQYGYSHGKRNIKDMDIRFAGSEAVQLAEARRQGRNASTFDPNEARSRIDRSDVWSKGSASLNVAFNGVPKGVKTNAELMDEGVFKTLNIKKSPATASAN